MVLCTVYSLRLCNSSSASPVAVRRTNMLPASYCSSHERASTHHKCGNVTKAVT
jgi:hypothetical protein